MKTKIVGIFVCTLLIATAVPSVTGSLKEIKNVSMLQYKQSNMGKIGEINFDKTDLLIISHEDFLNELKALQVHKNNTGVKTIIKSWQSLDNEYSGMGRDLQERIKVAISDYKQNYDIKYVMLVGDCDKCPVRYIKALTTEWGIKYYPSDLYYADLYDNYGNFDDWDGGDPPYGGNGYFGEMDFHGFSEHDLSKLNLDKIDGYPDVAVGRIPASTVQEVTTYVNKVISYEINALLSDWFNRALWVVDNAFGAPPKKDRLDIYLPNHYITKAYNAPGWNTWTRDQRAQYINDMINEGLGFVNYFGHGNRFTWAGIYDQYPPYNDMAYLTNSDMLPVIFAVSCYTGRFHFDLDYYQDVDGNEWNGGTGERPEPMAVQPSMYDRESLSEEFLVKRNTGAVAYIGCTSKNEYGGEDLDKYFFEAYYMGSPIGYMWNYALKEWMDNVDLCGNYAFIHMHKVMLFGDPSLRVGGRIPLELSITAAPGNFGIKALLRNNGDFTITEVSCGFSIRKALMILGRYKQVAPNPPGPIPPTVEAVAKTGLIFGFGPAEITFETRFQIEDSEFEVEKKATGLIIGPFVFNVKEI